MHPEAMSYVGRAKSIIPEPRSIIEFGAFDVNGSVRPIFPEAVWYGIDLRPGRGVNEVADCRTYQSLERYDLCICTEMLEHCSEPWLVIDAAKGVLKSGGHLVATMAAPERFAHDVNGDLWTPECGEHYKGIARDELERWLDGWEVVDLEHSATAGDLRCIARKP